MACMGDEMNGVPRVQERVVACFNCQHARICFLKRMIDAAQRTGCEMLRSDNKLSEATAQACVSFLMQGDSWFELAFQRLDDASKEAP